MTQTQIRARTAPVSRTRGRASGRWRSASSPAASDEEPLAELKELLRTAGVATAGEAVQHRDAAGSRPLLRPRQARRAEGGDRRPRRQPGRLRRRAGATPGAQPRGGARRAGDRPHRGHPRHLRRPRPLGRGQAPGRAGPARIQPGPHARAVDAPRAPRAAGSAASAPGARASPRSRPTAASPATGSRPCAAGSARLERNRGVMRARARALLAAAGRPRRLHQRRQVDPAQRADRAPRSGWGTGSSTRSTRPPAASSSTAATTC